MYVRGCGAARDVSGCLPACFLGIHAVLAELATCTGEIGSGDGIEPDNGPEGFMGGVLNHLGFLGLGLWAVRLGQDEPRVR